MFSKLKQNHFHLYGLSLLSLEPLASFFILIVDPILKPHFNFFLFVVAQICSLSVCSFVVCLICAYQNSQSMSRFYLLRIVFFPPKHTCSFIQFFITFHFPPVCDGRLFITTSFLLVFVLRCWFSISSPFGLVGSPSIITHLLWPLTPFTPNPLAHLSSWAC